MSSRSTTLVKPYFVRPTTRLALVALLAGSALTACSSKERAPDTAGAAPAAGGAPAPAPANSVAAAAPTVASLPGALTKPIDQYTGDEFYDFVQKLKWGGGAEKARKCKGNPGCGGTNPSQTTRVRVDAVDGQDSIPVTTLPANGVVAVRAGNKGTLDAKSTIRANLRFGGVPIDVRHRKRHLKPKLSIVCDLSTSMRPIVSFMLLLVYALQDQVSRTRSYAFVADLYDISNDFNESRPDLAIEAVQDRIRPGHYNTDLGNSLATFARDHMGTVDRRTTVIILGDGRNNYNDPNLRDFEDIKRRARKLVWFNPEHPRQWGTGDSDMPQYVPLCDAVHQVSNLRQLVDAVRHPRRHVDVPARHDRRELAPVPVGRLDGLRHGRGGRQGE